MRSGLVLVLALLAACGDNLVPVDRECNQPSDCPGSDGPCATKSCTDHTCGIALAPAGTMLAAQTAGDCQTAQCDGTGMIENVPDDSDAPAQPNACVTASCSNGAVVNGVAPIGTACGSGLECDGGGSCVHCNLPDECPGSDTDCQKRTCFSGVCGVDNLNAGTVAATQVKGDCQKLVCDGLGGETSVVDNTDKPVDNNACTADVCTNGVPSNPDLGAGTACGSGGECDGSGTCVQCLQPTDCPGSDSDCQVRTCIANTCGVANTAAGTPTSQQQAGDCQQIQCDGNGGTTSVEDDSDVPDDNNACTNDICTNGAPSHTDVGATTSCGAGLECDGNGNCVGCLQPSDCPGTDTDCHQRTCVAGSCGVANAGAGTLTSAQTAGDCKDAVCDGNGNVTTQVDDTDVPVDGLQCTSDVCSGGVPSNPPLIAGTTCTQGGGAVCDGNGACVPCNVESDCAGGPDTDCHTRTCTNHTCGIFDDPNGTLTSTQTTGDCRDQECDGNGDAVSVEDDGDVPNDNNPCTLDVCTAGVPSNPNVTAGTACGPGLCEVLGGDPTSRCQVPFVVVRLGDGTAALGTTAAPVFLDRFAFDGTPLGSTALPTATSGASNACTMQGTSAAEGELTRSADGHSLTLTCYGVAVGTATPSTAAGNRVVARIDGSGNVDTTTILASGFAAQPLRSAVTNNGTTVWVSGGNGGATGGVWSTTIGATTGEVQVLANPIADRQLAIANGQLFGTSSTSGFGNVFAIGSGLPTTTGQTATTLPGMTDAGNSLFGFALFDENPLVAGVDTLYAADAAAPASGGGVQKWTFDGTTWTLVTTFANGLSLGVQNLAAYQNGPSEVVILATLASGASVVRVVDDGSANPAFTTVATAATNEIYRGVAVVPQ